MEQSNILTAEAMGMNNPDLSDIKNHRIRIKVKDRSGALVWCDISAIGTAADTGVIDAQEETDKGFIAYKQLPYSVQFNKASILELINGITKEQYTELNVTFKY